MSRSNQAEQSVYAAAQGREFLRNALEGKENTLIFEYAGLIDDPEVLDFLNYYCGVYEDYGADFLETRVAEIVMQNAATHTADRAFREGNVSQLQGMVGLTDHSKDASDAMDEIVSRLAQEGTVAIVVGPPGAGKTATTLDAARAWGVKTGGAMFGNTDWDGFDKTVHTDRDLLEAMAGVEGQTLGVIDEGGQNLSGEAADSVKARALQDALELIRKKEKEHGKYAKQGSVLMVGHTLKRLAAEFRRLATLVIQKPSRKDPGKVVLYESQGGSDDLDKIGEFKGLTDTREDYPEHEASEFDVVMDDGDGDDDQDETSVEDADKDRQIRTAILAVEKRGMSYPDAADLVDYKDSWVGNRVREWRRGEHRDLVTEDEI